MAASINIHINGRDIPVGGSSPIAIFCGPCVIESREHALRMAEAIKAIALEVSVPLIYKSSFDKANRTSLSSFRGPGIEEGLRILQEVKSELELPIITDVHNPEDAKTVAEVADVLQIPAFLCRQSDLLLAVGECEKPVLIKKGQFVAPPDMKFAVEKVASTGNSGAMLCERGACFGYRDLVVDFRGLIQMRELGVPVVFDATHSVQVMGGAGGTSGGNRAYVSSLTRAAVALGIDGLFVECHNDPDNAPSDGPNMIQLENLAGLLADVKKLDELELTTRGPLE